MLHHRSRAAGLIALIALLVFTPGATAATPAKAAGAAKAKVRAYGKHCKGRGADRAKCLDAMSRLAAGTSTSPRSACRSLGRRKAKGAHKSAYARCVSEGSKLMKSKRGKKGAASDDDEGNWGDDPEPDDDGDSADGDDGAAGADDPDDLDPYGDTGAGDTPPAVDDDDPDAGRAQS